ncbi:MAG: hypothetical protein JXN59_18490 [Anaerolineae bacterium]|nr:hypothetical protein [Anaerolineae bacterium]
MKENRVLLDPKNPDEAIMQLAYSYDLDADTLEFLRRLLILFKRKVLLYVDESSTLFYGQMPLVDRFTFNMQADELILFASDPMTFVDALTEMAMFLAGFTTMIGVDESWKVEFAIGAWKPVKNRLKRELGIPVIDEPLWVVGLPVDPDSPPTDEINPFRTLVSQLDIASFTQMVRLAARDDVEVNFPSGTDPRVIQVYIRMKTALNQVADGITLDNWREFNHRLLLTVQNLEEEYEPHNLPLPAWWEEDAPDSAVPEGELEDLQFRVLDPDEWPEGVREDLPARPDVDQPEAPPDDAWDPFQTYIDELFDAGDDADAEAGV